MKEIIHLKIAGGYHEAISNSIPRTVRKPFTTELLYVKLQDAIIKEFPGIDREVVKLFRLTELTMRKL